MFGNTDLGRTGRVCLDPTSRVALRLNDLTAGGAVPRVADCYALNVSSEREAWLYYYTDFPLVRLVDGAVAEAHRKVGVTGAHPVHRWVRQAVPACPC